MLPSPHSPLQTERLQLRPLTPEDDPFLSDLVTTPSFEHVVGETDTVGETEALRTSGLLAVVLRDREETIGVCGLVRRPDSSEPELGYALLPEYWGKGYATEAAQAVLDWARDTQGLQKLSAVVALENEDSLAVLERLGFTLEGSVELPGKTIPYRRYTRDLRVQ